MVAVSFHPQSCSFPLHLVHTATIPTSTVMALAYAEGECFFNRKGLVTKDGYQATKPKDFYSHFMVEYVFNKEADHASANCNYPDGFKHPRSGYKIVSGPGWGTYYWCWENIPFSYGPKNEIARRKEHKLCVNGNRFVQLERGGSAEVSIVGSNFPIDEERKLSISIPQAWFMTLPLPFKKEKWIWIDVRTTLYGQFRPFQILIAFPSS